MNRPVLLSTCVLVMIGCLASFSLLMTGQIEWTIVSQNAIERFHGFHDNWNALLDERIPRLIVLICTGASLAASGAIMQSLFQNPLAAPSTLGLTAGSSLSVLMVLLTGMHLAYGWAIPVAAVSGSFIVLLLICILWGGSRHRPFTDLVLIGIAIATLLLAIQNALLYAYRDQWQLVQTITEWEAGSTFDRSWQHVHMQLPLTLIGLAICLYYRNEINIIMLGEEEATTLGIDINSIRYYLILAVSLLTGGSTAALGSVPFFGLILPHVVRKLHGANHRILIPLCMLAGAVTLVLFDLILRYSDLHFLTIGNLSAICGGIFFLLLLRKKPSYA